MFTLIRETRIFDEWFTESAAAIRHNDNNWVTARELVSDYARLGIVFNDEPVATLDQDKQHDFHMLLGNALDFFAKGKLLRQQPKAVYTSNLRIRLVDEQSYQLSNFGEKLLLISRFRRQSYIFAMLAWAGGVVLLKRYKWVIGVISTVAVVLRFLEVIESSIVAVMIAVVAIIVTAIIKSVFSSVD